jgi:hypothetical protein
VGTTNPFESGSFDESRRRFLKTAVTAAFVAPTVVSFTLDALARPSQAAGNMTVFCPNSSTGNGSVTPTTIKTGVINGAVNITSGSWLFDNATVTGSITVSNGADVELRNTEVKGGFTANGARDVSIGIGSTLQAITINKSIGFVYIDGNTIKGNVTLTQNMAGLRVSNNQITGSVALSANVTTCPGGGHVVDGNTIGGGVSAFNDVPPATGVNTVAGAHAGEL